MMMNAFTEHAEILRSCGLDLQDKCSQAAFLIRESLRYRGKILACGNGGSAADAEHFVAELVGRFRRERPGLPALALTSCSATLTAIANDYGYMMVFARQVDAYADSGDVLVAISTSATSANVIAAIEVAKRKGCHVIGLTGGSGFDVEVNVALSVPSRSTARVQEIHKLCLHAICEELE